MNREIDLYNIGNTPDELQAALKLLRADFDAHNHDGTSSRSFETLIAETIVARVFSIRKTNFNDETPGLWAGLVGGVMSFFLGDGENYLKWDDNGLNITLASELYTLGEDVAANDAVFLGVYLGDAGTSRAFANRGFTGDQVITVGDSSIYYQSVTYQMVVSGLIKSFGYDMSEATATATLTAYLYAVDVNNKPTGSPLATGSITTSVFSGVVSVPFTTPAHVDAGTKYAFVIKVDTNGGGGDVFFNSSSGSGSGGAGDTLVEQHSSSNGSSWSTYSSNVLACSIVYTIGDYGKIYKADADFAASAKRFIGFVKEAASAGDRVKVISGQVLDGFVGLSPGSTYYISTVAGAITNSAPSNVKIVGTAISSTALFVTAIGDIDSLSA